MAVARQSLRAECATILRHHHAISDSGDGVLDRGSLQPGDVKSGAQMIWTEDETTTLASYGDAFRAGAPLVGRVCSGFTALLILFGLVGLVQSLITM